MSLSFTGADMIVFRAAFEKISFIFTNELCTFLWNNMCVNCTMCINIYRRRDKKCKNFGKSLAANLL